MDIKNLIAYFIIYSFLGWVIESIYKTVLSKKPVNSGFLYGPFCPIYGFGTLIMSLCLKYFEKNVVALFFVSFVILSIWEYIVSVLLEKIFKTKYWDYSEYKFNINGRVCLKNSIFWGLLGVGYMLIANPPIQKVVEAIPNSLLIYSEIIIFCILVVDCIVSIIKLYNINISIQSIIDISKNIKQEVLNLKEYATSKAKESEGLQRLIEELKQKQEALKNKLEKQTARLRKAFPTMKSERMESIKKTNRNEE